MRQLLIAISVMLLTPFETYSQKNCKKWLTHKFKTADKVLLISHQMVEGSTDEILDKEGNSIILPKLIIKGKLNHKVIKEEKLITGIDIDILLQILTRPKKDSIIIQGGCFVSRQSIIILKKFKTSYIDICFHCSSYETSKNLQKIAPFDHRMWRELENYFRQHGLTYALEK